MVRFVHLIGMSGTGKSTCINKLLQINNFKIGKIDSFIGELIKIYGKPTLKVRLQYELYMGIQRSYYSTSNKYDFVFFEDSPYMTPVYVGKSNMVWIKLLRNIINPIDKNNDIFITTWRQPYISYKNDPQREWLLQNTNYGRNMSKLLLNIYKDCKNVHNVHEFDPDIVLDILSDFKENINI